MHRLGAAKRWRRRTNLHRRRREVGLDGSRGTPGRGWVREHRSVREADSGAGRGRAERALNEGFDEGSYM